MSKNFGVDFREDVVIDKYRLNDECEVQPAMYYFYSSKLAEARAEQEGAKNKLDYVLGSRELAIRSNPPDGIKITEAVITACLATDTEVLAAKEALATANAAVTAMYSAVNALEQRKSMLDNLTRLQISSSYQSTDNVGDDIRAGMNKRG